MNQPSRLFMEITPPLPDTLLDLFQKGVRVEVELGVDLLTLLKSDLCLTDQGIDKIQTIFWQGKPVDDLEASRVEEGGVLALSAALPGLVGACLRRAGAWSALRSSISYRGEKAEAAGRRGMITFKLFNFMLQEVGPVLLSRGVHAAGEELKEVIDSGQFQDRTVRLVWEDQLISPEDLSKILGSKDDIWIRVETSGQDSARPESRIEES